MSNLQFRFSDYRFQPSWLGTLITVCCIPLFIKLGYWQYHKAQQKLVLQATYQRYEHAVPVDLPSVIGQVEPWRYRLVQAVGHYLPQYQILLDNQVEDERVGYHVITPLQINGSDSVVLVDRGWIPAQDSHSDIPVVDTPTGEQQVIGKVWLPSTKFYTLPAALGAKQTEQGWQTVWQNMDMQHYQQAVPFKTLPVAIRLDPASNAGGFVRNWVMPDDRVATNISYAYQWFGFAVAALVIYVVVSVKKYAGKPNDNAVQEP